MKITSSIFVRSSACYQQCPVGSQPEVAFIGRSNVGKSSLINALLGRRCLAKVSGKPGKTQLINHFLVNDAWHLVDLPGYGWARVSRSVRRRWPAMVREYMLHRRQLCCVFVLVDARHPPQRLDLDFIRWLGSCRLPLAVVLTKADKVARQRVLQNEAALQQALCEDWEELPPMMVTSAKEGTGRVVLLDYIQGIVGPLLPH